MCESKHLPFYHTHYQVTFPGKLTVLYRGICSLDCNCDFNRGDFKRIDGRIYSEKDSVIKIGILAVVLASIQRRNSNVGSRSSQDVFPTAKTSLKLSYVANVNNKFPDVIFVSWSTQLLVLESTNICPWGLEIRIIINLEPSKTRMEIRHIT